MLRCSVLRCGVRGGEHSRRLVAGGKKLQQQQQRFSMGSACRAALHQEPLSWAELGSHVEETGWLARDLVNGPTNSQTRLRLFGEDESAVRVTLYRDNHAWCPYCQKIWLWLEEKKVPYRIEKVTMFCYGEKEAWYKQKVSECERER